MFEPLSRGFFLRSSLEEKDGIRYDFFNMRKYPTSVLIMEGWFMVWMDAILPKI